MQQLLSELGIAVAGRVPHILFGILNTADKRIVYRTEGGRIYQFNPFIISSDYVLDTSSFTWQMLFLQEAERLACFRRTRHRAIFLDSDRYACNLSGQCERTARFDGKPLAECQATCQSAENRDLLYLILANNPEQVRQLAESDQVRVVRDMLGLNVDAAVAHDILVVLAENDWTILPTIPELQPYLDSQYDYLDQVLRIIAAESGIPGSLPLDWEQLKEQVLADEGLWEIVSRRFPNLEPSEAADEMANRDTEVYFSLVGYFTRNPSGLNSLIPDLWQNLAIYQAEREVEE